MLHSLPVLLDDLERRLIAGEDPLPLLGAVRWSELGGWPQDVAELVGVVRRERHRAHPEILGEQAIAEQPQQGREQIALGQVACGTEQEEGVVHGSSFVFW